MNLPQLPQDKANHVVYGTVIYAIAAPFLGPLVSLIPVALVAIGKEVYDYKSKTGTPDALDAVATIVGPVALNVSDLFKLFQ
jgi:hypothetical protein